MARPLTTWMRWRGWRWVAIAFFAYLTLLFVAFIPRSRAGETVGYAGKHVYFDVFMYDGYARATLAISGSAWTLNETGWWHARGNPY